MATDRTRNYSDILNGGQAIDVLEPGMIGLEIKEPSNGQDENLLQFERNLHGQRVKFHALEVIDTSMDFYIKTNGNDNNDGSSTTPWKSPHKAMEWLSKFKIIGEDTVITINFGEGEFTYTEPLICQHPDGHKIKFIGVGFENNSLRPRSFKWGNCSGLTPDSDIVFEWPEVRESEVGETYYFQNTAGVLPCIASNEAQPNNSVPVRIPYIESDRVANEAFLRSRYKTILTFDGLKGGIRVISGSIGLVDNMAIIADDYHQIEGDDWHNNDIATGIEAYGISRKGDLRGSGGTSITVGPNVALHGWGGYAIYACGSGSIFCLSTDEIYSGVTVTGSNFGIGTTRGGSIESRRSTIQGCMGVAISAYYNSSVIADFAWISGGGSHGILASESSAIHCNYVYVSGFAYSGIYAHMGSSIRCSDSWSWGNGNSGYIAHYSSSMWGAGANSVGNYSHGFYVSFSSYLLGNTYNKEPDDEEHVHKKSQSKNNGGYGLAVGYSSSGYFDNVVVQNNRQHGIVVYHTSTLHMVNKTDTHGYQQPFVGENGYYPKLPGQSSASLHYQIGITRGASAVIYGTRVRRRRNVDYHAIVVAHQSYLGFSADDVTSSDGLYDEKGHQLISYNKGYVESNQYYSNGSTDPYWSNALVRCYDNSNHYDSYSNISTNYNNTRYFNPRRNSYVVDGGYVRVNY